MYGDPMRLDFRPLKASITDLQCHSMKMNLIFTGIGGEIKNEDTEDKLRSFLYYELGIDEHIQFGNVHRLGRHIRGQDKKIVARFLYQKDLVAVRSRSHRLHNTCYGMRKQYPTSIERLRKEIYPAIRYHWSCGDNVKMVRDKLCVNGHRYDPETEPTDESTYS